MAGIATSVDHTIAEMIRGIKVPDACAQAKQAINATKVATENVKAFKVDTTGIEAAVKSVSASNVQVKQTLKACEATIERVKAITPANT